MKEKEKKEKKYETTNNELSEENLEQVQGGLNSLNTPAESGAKNTHVRFF